MSGSKRASQTDESEQPRGELALRTIAMPRDTNDTGDIFGGWVMAQMDSAAGVTAWSRAQGRVATVAVDGFVFHQPVFVGDLVSCYAEVTRVGRTSIAVLVQAWVLRRPAGQAPTKKLTKVTEGTFTFVALDENRNKRPVPPQGEK